MGAVTDLPIAILRAPIVQRALCKGGPDFGAFNGDGACADGDRALFRDVASRAD